MKRLINPEKALRTLRKTPVLLAALLNGVSAEQAARLRDGPDGWSMLYTLCHMRDEEAIFTQRVSDLLARPNPTFAYVLNDDLVARNKYDAADFHATVDEFLSRRRAFITLLEGVSDEQWQLEGVHPLQGPATLLDVALNVGLHDVDHLEQIARALAGTP
ncbi:MAG: DinB family protein [Chloroflexi bacterium]|nr:DinB family protein [Chloroflexota bacterium]